MKVEDFTNIIHSDFYTGVPDSLLRPLCDYLVCTYGTDPSHHIIAANEGNCVAVAAGYYLSTGRVPVVYMQNSGEGNAINPIASLLNKKVYNIPVIFIIGWRGEPGVHDEPQHAYQGEITVKLLDVMGIRSYVVGKATTTDEMISAMKSFLDDLRSGNSVAFVIKKDALEYENRVEYQNKYCLSREDVIGDIAEIAGDDPIICTTGKASRELFEYRERNDQTHAHDFLTVGSMGHASSIALGIAVTKPDTRVWCIDGDGAALMHMGAMSTIGSIRPENLVHIVLNNEAHETVGGMPTAARSTDLTKTAMACGYETAVCVQSERELMFVLNTAKKIKKLLIFIEVKCRIGSRSDLGRPTTTAEENKRSFMEYLSDHC